MFPNGFNKLRSAKAEQILSSDLCSEVVHVSSENYKGRISGVVIAWSDDLDAVGRCRGTRDGGGKVEAFYEGL